MSLKFRIRKQLLTRNEGAALLEKEKGGLNKNNILSNYIMNVPPLSYTGVEQKNIFSIERDEKFQTKIDKTNKLLKQKSVLPKGKKPLPDIQILSKNGGLIKDKKQQKYRDKVFKKIKKSKELTETPTTTPTTTTIKTTSPTKKKEQDEKNDKKYDEGDNENENEDEDENEDENEGENEGESEDENEGENEGEIEKMSAEELKKMRISEVEFSNRKIERIKKMDPKKQLRFLKKNIYLNAETYDKPPKEKIGSKREVWMGKKKYYEFTRGNYVDYRTVGMLIRTSSDKTNQFASITSKIESLRKLYKQLPFTDEPKKETTYRTTRRRNEPDEAYDDLLLSPQY